MSNIIYVDFRTARNEAVQRQSFDMLPIDHAKVITALREIRQNADPVIHARFEQIWRVAYEPPRRPANAPTLWQWLFAAA